MPVSENDCYGDTVQPSRSNLGRQGLDLCLLSFIKGGVTAFLSIVCSVLQVPPFAGV